MKSYGGLLPALVVMAVFIGGCSAPSGVRLRVAPASTAIASAAPVTAGATSTPVPHTITIAAVGDLMFARDVTTLMEDRGAGYPFERVRGLWADADIVVGNLEGTYTRRGTAMGKQYTFRTPPPLARALSLGGLHAVALANNHMYDFGASGLEDTLEALRVAAIQHFGAGPNEAAATRHLVLNAKDGTRVAFLSFNDIGEVQYARSAQPGVAQADPAVVARAVRAARADADFVVVYFHWGAEYTREPTARQWQLAQAAVSGGAAAVVGGHPHVLQRWERVEGVPVLFSMGNFVFDLEPADVDWLGTGPFQSAIAMITLSRDAPARITFRPVTIDANENRPRPATEAEAIAILGWLEPSASQARR